MKCGRFLVNIDGSYSLPGLNLALGLVAGQGKSSGGYAWYFFLGSDVFDQVLKDLVVKKGGAKLSLALTSLCFSFL